MVANKKQEINTILNGRCYLQNCKAITIEKIANHTKNKKPIKDILIDDIYLSRCRLLKSLSYCLNHSFLHPFLPLGETDFRKNSVWRNE